MAPSATSVLFHPKKPFVKREPVPTNASAAPRASGPIALGRQLPNRDQLVAEILERPTLPEGTYQEYKLLSSSRHGWKYDVMKFESRKPVDITTWPGPVKLNRKQLKRSEEMGIGGLSDKQRAIPMLGPDGQPVIGSDGKIVMVDSEGKPIHPSDGANGSSSKGKDADKDKRKKFQKKTRQVFLIPEEIRQLRKEERYPWVMEDGSGREVWVGMMEEASKADNHALFMPTTGSIFKFVPAHRWYKFQRRPTHLIPSLEEAEKLMVQMQKNKDPERWLLHKRNGQAPSAATAALFKAESEGRSLAGEGSLVHTAGLSLGPGGRRLKAVDSGMNGLFDDDEEGVDTKRKREKEFGGEGDVDEFEFEEEFADDEEVADVEESKDDETKEMEERLKREYKNANKQREGYVDEDPSDDEEEHLTGAGKAMKKLVRKVEKNAAYDSDNEKNPYASSSEEDEEEEEPQQIATGPQPQTNTRPGSQAPAPTETKTPQRAIPAPSGTASRNGSPVPTAGLGGHSIVAQRATSPKIPKQKAPMGSRASSPLASTSRAGSPPAPISPSRATSPVASGPVGMPKTSVKRKAEDGAPPNGVPNGHVPQAPKAKKRKAGPPAGGAVPGLELREDTLVDWLRRTPNATTRDCIQYFHQCLTDETMKTRFTQLVKEVAILKQGTLTLKAQYRE